LSSSADPPDERPDAEAEVEELRRTVARLADHERRLRSELEVERGGHEADVSRLEAEIEAQGTRLADSRRQARELRDRLTALRAQRARSIRHRIAKLPLSRMVQGRRPDRSAETDPHTDRPPR
jgi:septal ring factor EnvC (AmiA/AmiB activator)